MKILFIIDHPVRDLPALTSWAFNYFNLFPTDTILFSSTSEISPKFLLDHRPDAIVWNYLRPQNCHLFAFSKCLNSINIVHDTEGIPYDFNDYFKSISPAYLRCIDIVLAWGQFQTDFLRNLFKSNKLANIKVLNFGAMRYQHYYENPLTDRQPSKILVNTNFPIISPRYGSLLNEKNIWVNIEKIV